MSSADPGDDTSALAGHSSLTRTGRLQPGHPRRQASPTWSAANAQYAQHSRA